MGSPNPQPALLRGSFQSSGFSSRSNCFWGAEPAFRSRLTPERCRAHLGFIQLLARPVPGEQFGKMKPSKEFCSRESDKQGEPLKGSSALLAPALCTFQLPPQSRSSSTLPGGCSSYAGCKAAHRHAQLLMACRPPQLHTALRCLGLTDVALPMSGSRDLFKPFDVDGGKKHIESLAAKGSRGAGMGACKSRRSNSLEQQRWYWHSSVLRAAPRAGELLCSGRKPALTPLSPPPPCPGFGCAACACCNQEHHCRAARWDAS